MFTMDGMYRAWSSLVARATTPPPSNCPPASPAAASGATTLAHPPKASAADPPAPPATPAPLLACLRARRSIMPRRYVKDAPPVPAATMRRMLEAAMWAPFHGPVPPWRFVVLGKEAMVAMQHLTLEYYDANWQDVGWADGQRGSEAQYQAWRAMTEGEIRGRWGPVSYMVAIVVRRQAGSKRMPAWEEAAATACAVQNMHVQACAEPGLACYWSSWHDAARDSAEMRAFLNMGEEDRCLGFFIVARGKVGRKDNRQRTAETHLDVEWRP